MSKQLSSSSSSSSQPGVGSQPRVTQAPSTCGIPAVIPTLFEHSALPRKTTRLWYCYIFIKVTKALRLSKDLYIPYIKTLLYNEKPSTPSSQRSLQTRSHFQTQKAGPVQQSSLFNQGEEPPRDTLLKHTPSGPNSEHQACRQKKNKIKGNSTLIHSFYMEPATREMGRTRIRVDFGANKTPLPPNSSTWGRRTRLFLLGERGHAGVSVFLWCGLPLLTSSFSGKRVKQGEKPPDCSDGDK